MGAWLWHGEKGKGEPGKAWAGHREGRARGRLPGEDRLEGEGLCGPLGGSSGDADPCPCYVPPSLT